MVPYFVAALPHFLAYFGTAVALAAAFLFVYSRSTPHPEFALIGQGNTAAACQLTGTFLGFCLPVAMVIAHSVNLIDMVLWGTLAALIQLAIFLLVARFLFRSISQRIEEGCTASGVFIGGLGTGVGVLQAACMVP